MSKVLVIAGKTLKELFRQPKSLAITLALPLMFMLIFGLAFGRSAETTYDVAVLRLDEGELARSYHEGLAKVAYASGTPVLALHDVADEESGRDGLDRGDYDALLVIPANFSENALPQGEAPGGGPVPPLQQPQAPPEAVGARVAILGDPSRVPFQVSSQVIAAYTARFAESVPGGRPAVASDVQPVTAAELTNFDFIAPGLMVFAILNIIPQAAGALARESEMRTLDRLRMSPTGSLPILGGVALGQIAIACVSLALMLVTARLMGFHNQGSYLVAYAIAIGAAIAATGIGLVIAAFARNQQEAASFGALVSVPMSFLSGAFFAIPGVAIGRFELYDALPTKHAVDAMRQVMTLGRTLDDVAGSLVALAVLGVVYLVVGVLVYRRTRLAPE